MIDAPYFYNKKGPNQFDLLYAINYHEIALEAKKFFAESTRVIMKPNKYAFILVDFQIGLLKHNKQAAHKTCGFLYEHIEDMSDLFLFMQSNSFNKINFSSFWNDKYGRPVSKGTSINLDKMKQGNFVLSESVKSNIGQCEERALERIVGFAVNNYGSVDIESYGMMRGGVSAALIPAIEEASFYHSCLSGRQSIFDYSGIHPLENNLSIFRSIVSKGPTGAGLCENRQYHFDMLSKYEKIFFAGSSRQKVIASANDAAVFGGFKEKVVVLNDCCGNSLKGNGREVENIVLEDNNFSNTNEWKR